MTLTTQGLLCILWIFSNNKAKSHEKASGYCAGAFVCPGFLWVGAAPQGNLKEWAAPLFCWRRERSWQVLQTFYPYGAGGVLSGFCRSSVTLTCDCFSPSHQVWAGWMWCRVPQPWVSRREPALLCGVISPPWQTMCSGIFRTPGATSSTYFTFLQGQSRMEQSPQSAAAPCTFPLRRPQTRALTSVLHSTVLPRHLQPLHKPSRGSAPPPATVTPWGHHRAFAVLNVTHLHQYSFNHRYFLALQIMDFGLYLPFSVCVSICTRNF